MKKFLSTIAVMMASLASVFSANAQTSTTADDKPILTIGCLSDLHNQHSLISGSVDDVKLRGTINTVLQTMKDKERIDMLILGGDYTSDVTIPEENWAKVRDLLQDATKSAFPDGTTHFPVLYVTGNHDYEVAGTTSINSANKNFNAARYYEHVMKNDLGELPATETFYEQAWDGTQLLAAYHYLIGGIDFVVLNCGKNYYYNAWDYTYSTESIQWVADKLEQLYTKDSDKTVFFVAHVPFSDSNSISAADKGQKEDQLLRETLAKYPNTIFLYGHDHGSDNAYIRTHTSQRITRYDSFGNVISHFDDTHFDGLGSFSAPTEYEPAPLPEIYDTFPADFYVVNKADGKYLANDGYNTATVSDIKTTKISYFPETTTTFLFEVDPKANGQNHIHIGSGTNTNGLVNNFSVGDDDTPISIYKVSENNNGTISAQKVSVLNSADDFIIVATTTKNVAGDYALTNVVTNQGSASGQRLCGVGVNLSSDKNSLTVTTTEAILWNFELKPADPVVEPDPSEPVVLYNTAGDWEFWACTEQEVGSEPAPNGPLTCLFDCNPATYYHNNWNAATGFKDKYSIPHYVAVDLKESKTIAGIEWCGATGKGHNWRQVTLYTSDNKDDFVFTDEDHTDIHNWHNAHKGEGLTLTLTSNSASEIEKVLFADGATLTGRYVLVVVEKTVTNEYGSAGELGFVVMPGGSSSVEPEPVEPVIPEGPFTEGKFRIINQQSQKNLGLDDGSLNVIDTENFCDISVTNANYGTFLIKLGDNAITCGAGQRFVVGSDTDTYFYKVASKTASNYTLELAREFTATDEYVIAMFSSRSPWPLAALTGNDYYGYGLSGISISSDASAPNTLTVAANDAILWKFAPQAVAAAPARAAALYADAQSYTEADLYVVNKANGKILAYEYPNFNTTDDDNKCHVKRTQASGVWTIEVDELSYLQASTGKYILSSTGKSLWIFKVASNDGSTINGQLVTEINTEDEYLIIGNSGGYQALSSVLLNAGTADQYMSSVGHTAFGTSPVFNLSFPASDAIIWKFATEKPAVGGSEPEPPVVVIPDDALYSGDYCVRNVGNGGYLTYDATKNVTSVTDAITSTISSTDGVFQIKMQGGNNDRYLYVGGSGWSGNTSATNAGTKLSLYEVDEVSASTINAHKVTYFQLGKQYLITAVYSGNTYVVSNERNSSDDRFVPYAATLDGDNATIAGGDGFIWEFTEMPAAEPSFISSFMGSMRYYNSVAATGSSADDSAIAQALMIYVYNDHIVFQMKNYAQSGNVGGVEIAEKPAAYTLVRNVVKDNGVSTSIFETEVEEATADDDTIFDLLGRRVNKADRGLYIIGGRKVIK